MAQTDETISIDFNVEDGADLAALQDPVTLEVTGVRVQLTMGNARQLLAELAHALGVKARYADGSPAAPWAGQLETLAGAISTMHYWN